MLTSVLRLDAPVAHDRKEHPMRTPHVRQGRFALFAGIAAITAVQMSTEAFATAKDLEFEGSWLFAVSVVVIAVVALWLTCVGALRSDRHERYRATSGTDRGGPVYTDIDGHLHVH
jgi:hypothetical protein